MSTGRGQPHYSDAGRTAEAINLYEQTLTDMERLLGPEHPDTLTSRNNLANAYRGMGRDSDADALASRRRTGLN